MPLKKAWSLARIFYILAIVVAVARVLTSAEFMLLRSIFLVAFFVFLGTGFILIYKYHRCPKCGKLIPFRFREIGDCIHCPKETDERNY